MTKLFCSCDCHNKGYNGCSLCSLEDRIIGNHYLQYKPRKGIDMDYELCKKLKENGFPQDGNGMWWNRSVELAMSNLKLEVSEAYVPTLDELIEACGDEIALFKMGNQWTAVKHAGIEKALNWMGVNVHLTEFDAKGSTPSEAVANLWLKLNSKP